MKVKQVKSISLLKWQKFNYGIQNRISNPFIVPHSTEILQFFDKILNSDTKPQICVIPLPCVGKKNIFDWKEKKLLPGIHRPVA